MTTVPAAIEPGSDVPPPAEITDSAGHSTDRAGLPSTDVIEIPASISAASLRQALRQFGSGRVIVVVTRNGHKRPAESAASRAWYEHRREGASSPETGLVLAQSLRRQAEAQGLEVALVTRDGKLRQQAEEAGIPVFSTLAGAQDHDWRLEPSQLDYRPPSPGRDAHDPVSTRRRGLLAARFRRVRIEQGDRRPMPAVLETFLLLGFLGLIVVMVASVLAFLVPAATVRLVPAQEPLAETITIRARSDVEAADFGDKVIPARRIGQRVDVDGTIQSTGSEAAPDQPAQGTVVFTGRRPDPQEIPPGTVVATSTGTNIRFETTAPATLPGGAGAQVTVPIQAIEPGPQGNVRAFTISTIEGPLSISANVTNPSGTFGGTVKQVPTVKQADKDRLRAQLEQQAKQKAYAALSELLEEGEFVPPETIATLVTDETYDRFTDEAAGEVTLRLRLLATALAVDGKAADEMALRALGERIPRRGRMEADEVRYTRGPATVAQEADAVVITFDNTASSVVVLDIDPAAVRGTIRGLPPDEAVAALEQNWRLQTPPELTLGPEWIQPILRKLDFSWLPLPVVDRVPWLPFRTHVQVQL